MTSFVLLTFAAAFLLSAAATALMRRLAPRWGLVDAPDAARKVHTSPTPLGGGVAVWFAVIAPLLGGVAAAAAIRSGWAPESIAPDALRPHLTGAGAKMPTLLTVLGAGTVLAAVGLWDDRRGLPWGWRLLVQFGCAAAVVAAGVRFSLFLPDLPGRIAAAGLTALWLVVLTNAFNFLDNMNGLCSGTAAIAAGVLAAIMLFSLPRPHWFVGAMTLTLCGALVGFLFHNWRGRIFLGDAGSTFVGFMLAVCCALGTFYEAPVEGAGAGIHGFGNHVILAPLCVLAVPLYDFATVITIRLRDGASPFRPDRNHFSHRLNDRGLSKRGAVKTVWLCTLVTGLAGLLLYRVDGWIGAGLAVAIVAGVLGIVAVLEFSTGRDGAVMPGLVPRPPSDGPSSS
ncbi:MraY family glycosyltransferase [Alienimonas chondri]|uniref:Undecaprenyl-phosphate N-acetylglucosaminyl 1-phosphate transferase n=1 Tax=Alienimonas chondri TaxID=2681879 RepID=A0ABX1VDT3_9PLAN|nr:MraY family glycosyltransferase [Alienimonas chondri]NNJ25581.1 putative undecaprenyl-phosphate N-acetylglucosaminyl 1-phosphate transferase [Alienimonas chondri]